MSSKSTNVSKNVTLLRFEKRGVDTYKLLGPTGEIHSFSVFAESLLDAPANTRKTYCYALAHFFDYFFEAGIHLSGAHVGKTGFSRAELKDIIDGWDDYLTIGESSGRDIVGRVCQTLPSPRITRQSSSVKHAALSHFLGLSEDTRKEMAELSSLGLLTASIDTCPLFESTHAKKSLSASQRQAMIASSMLSGVIAGGPKLKPAHKSLVSDVVQYDKDRAFPMDLVKPFVNCLSTERDKALFSLIAACGCRSSEARQILWEDIDVGARTVKLIDPKRRVNHQSYSALTPRERDKLVWKCRFTDDAFLIEPFASMFFEHLEKYLRNEYYPHLKHDFVFQILKGDVTRRGRPFFLTAQSTRQEIFDAAARKIQLPPNVHGPHALRHMYGTYLLNYFPLANGQYGLSMAVIRVMLGHKKIESTEKYAVHDQEMIKAQLEMANALVFGGVNHKTSRELQIAAAQAQAKKFEQIAYELSLEDEDD